MDPPPQNWNEFLEADLNRFGISVAVPDLETKIPPRRMHAILFTFAAMGFILAVVFTYIFMAEGPEEHHEDNDALFLTLKDEKEVAQERFKVRSEDVREVVAVAQTILASDTQTFSITKLNASPPSTKFNVWFNMSGHFPTSGVGDEVTVTFNDGTPVVIGPLTAVESSNFAFHSVVNATTATVSATVTLAAAGANDFLISYLSLIASPIV